MASKKTYPRLSKAPIAMAILEIRYNPPETLTNEGLDGVKKALEKEYPIHSYTRNAELEFRPDQQNSTSLVHVKSNSISGILLQSASRKQEIQLSIKSYNFKQHGSYTTWEDFKSVALDGWNKCRPFVKPESINWLSVRYINNVEIPFKEGETVFPKDIFKTFIATEDESNLKALANYMLKFSHMDEKENLVIHFGQELLQGQNGILPFIVDVDVIFNQSSALFSDNEIAEKFDYLRQVKNEYFFNNLTKSTLNLLK